ncbi:hypothetical protein NL341_27670, partial [Klebsiella pneumoniae]|nr:hypothetical protein [Klebsiella pneumoniae]
LASVYFVAFLLIGLFLLLQLTTAVVFNYFQRHSRAQLLKALAHRDHAMQAVFTLLVLSQPAEEDSHPPGLLALSSWTAFLLKCR